MTPNPAAVLQVLGEVDPRHASPAESTFCSSTELEMLRPQYPLRCGVPMFLFPDQPSDQFVSHHGGGRPLASSERWVQVSEPWIESGFSAGRQRHCTPIRCCSSLAGEQTSEWRRLASRSGMRQRGADLRQLTLDSRKLLSLRVTYAGLQQIALTSCHPQEELCLSTNGRSGPS
jgi:hypothetical protein